MKAPLKILLIEPWGAYIRLDRCMQSIDSWGGVYRFPLNLARIAAHLMSLGHEVRFMDFQADWRYKLPGQAKRAVREFEPDMCILSSGFPSMEQDAFTAGEIRWELPRVHISTFGVVPTLLGEKFFTPETWNFWNPFDSIVVGGEPAFGYEQLINEGIERGKNQLILSQMEKTKSIQTYEGRKLFNHDLYRSPFTGGVQTYVEGSYGCPHRCTFCVVPQLYDGHFAKRTPEDVVREFVFVLENSRVQQISLWDEGTTFQRSQIKNICEQLIEVRKSKNPTLRNFSWNTRSTTALLDEETVELMKLSGMSGITLGLESFDETVLGATGKGTTVSNNLHSIELLKSAGIISIGHIVLGLPEETKQSAESTIEQVVHSNLDVAQFYCAVPYPSTPLHEQASKAGLIQVHDLTKYELCNPIMDTLGGLTYKEVGALRQQAMHQFYEKKNLNLDMLQSKAFNNWIINKWTPRM